MRDCLRLASRWKPSTGSAAPGQMVAFQTEQNSHLDIKANRLETRSSRDTKQNLTTQAAELAQG